MDKTYRLAPFYRKLGPATLAGFLAWAALDLYVVRTDATIAHPVGFGVIAVGVPLGMAGLSAWLMATSFRHELTIRDGRVTSRGVVRETTVNLRDVTRARWRPLPAGGGSLKIRSPSARLTIEFGLYEAPDRLAMIRRLREAIPAEVQVDWNLYAFKFGPMELPSAPAKPGPDEVLLPRSRWNRYLAPMVGVTSLIGLFRWWTTGELARSAAMPVAAVVGWLLLRMATPARGMVTRKLSTSFRRDDVQFLAFLPAWFLVAVAGLAAHESSRASMAHPTAALVAGSVAWLAVLLYEASRLDRKSGRRDRESADLAAKLGGEPPSDPWPPD